MKDITHLASEINLYKPFDWLPDTNIGGDLLWWASLPEEKRKKEPRLTWDLMEISYRLGSYLNRA